MRKQAAVSKRTANPRKSSLTPGGKRATITRTGPREDEFRVYQRSLSDHPQFEGIQYKGGHRVVHIDPEVVFRMATLGLDRKMVGGYYGITPAKFNELCADYPDLEEAYLQGMSIGILKAATSLEKQVAEGSPIPTIFRCKVGGMIEADKRKDASDSEAPRVQIYLPDNERD